MSVTHCEAAIYRILGVIPNELQRLPLTGVGERGKLPCPNDGLYNFAIFSRFSENGHRRQRTSFVHP